MNSKYNPAIEEAVAEYARRAEDWFRVWFTDPPTFEERLRAGLRFGSKNPYVDNKVELTKSLGMFSPELFQAMLCGGEPFKPMMVSILWDRLVEAGLAIKSFSVVPGGGTPFATHQIDRLALVSHLNDGTFRNLFASPSRLPETYAHAVVAIDVCKPSGHFRGTGFVVEHDEVQVLVTCKHNVDPAAGIDVEKITSAAGAALNVHPFSLSPNYDIATARLMESVAKPSFVLSDNVEIFDEVYTLGYPLVPRAEPLLLGHRGELNGRANLYIERCPALIISNLVSPGSSGGPVLTRDGHCVGMTIKWLEGERQDEERLEWMRFSAALPAHLLREAVIAQLDGNLPFG